MVELVEGGTAPPAAVGSLATTTWARRRPWSSAVLPCAQAAAFTLSGWRSRRFGWERTAATHAARGSSGRAFEPAAPPRRHPAGPPAGAHGRAHVDLDGVAGTARAHMVPTSCEHLAAASGDGP